MSLDEGTDQQKKVKIPKPEDLSPWASPADRERSETYWGERRKPAPEPEVRETPIVQGDDRMPGGAKQILNLAAKEGWTHTYATYSRGPIMHSTTREFLRMADFVIVKGARGNERFLASWVDGKFDYGYAGDHGARADKLSAADLKARIKA